MVVGIARITFLLHDTASLKEKRMVVKKITDKVKRRFNVSIAEVDSQDVLSRAVIGITAVGGDNPHVNSTVDKVVNFIDRLHLAEIVDESMELISY